MILVLVRLVTSGILYYVIVYRFKEIVQIAVNNESRGLYAFDASHIDFSLFKRRLIVDDARVYCTDTLHTPHHYDVTIPKIHLAIQSWRALIFHQRVLIDSLKIDRPVLYEHEHLGIVTPKSKAAIETNEVITILKTMSRHLQIKKFKVVGGTYLYRNLTTPKPFLITHINFYLRNFSRKNNPSHHFFGAEEIDVDIENQHWFLPDGKHELSFRRLYFSGRSQFIKIDSAVFQTRTGNQDILLRADRLQFNSRTLAEKYTSKGLVIDTLICQSPQLLVQQTDMLSDRVSLSHALVAMLHGIRFQYIDVRSGQIRFVNAEGTATGRRLNLKIYNLQIPADSTAGLKSDSISPEISNIHLSKSKTLTDY